jgi:MipA family protein
MRLLLLFLSLASSALWCSLTWAQEPMPAMAPAPAAASVSATPELTPLPPRPAVWEGALGLTSAFRPEYSGAAKQAFKLNAGFFLRYGRLTITNASGFVTRRSDEVVRGLGLDVVRSDKLRLSLGLRYDRGRKENVSGDLAGLGDIKATVRARLSVTRLLADGWKLGGSWSVDALGRGDGYVGDVTVSHDQRLTEATTLSAGVSLGLAGDRYMQTYYGVSETQAARSGYPRYDPDAGLRDIGVSVGTRTQLDENWVLLSGIGASQLLGSAASSPLTRNISGWGMNVGVARRF